MTRKCLLYGTASTTELEEPHSKLTYLVFPNREPINGIRNNIGRLGTIQTKCERGKYASLKLFRIFLDSPITFVNNFGHRK